MTDQKELNEAVENQDEAAQGAAEAGGSELDNVKAALEQAEAKAQENWELALRTKADAENLRRRLDKDMENLRKFGAEKIITELLPILDSMELGLAAIEGDSPEVAKFKEGSELTLKMLNGVVEKFGVKPLNPEGEKFNPEQHQAMSIQENNEVEPNTVIAVVQKGYILHERVVRPAMVIVSKAATPPPEHPGIDETA